MAAVIMKLEHLDRCSTCSRRTLHRRVITSDEGGLVVSDVRACVPCASRDAGLGPADSPVLAMKEARSLGKKLRFQATKKRPRPTR